MPTEFLSIDTRNITTSRYRSCVAKIHTNPPSLNRCNQLCNTSSTRCAQRKLKKKNMSEFRITFPLFLHLKFSPNFRIIFSTNRWKILDLKVTPRRLGGRTLKLINLLEDLLHSSLDTYWKFQGFSTGRVWKYTAKWCMQQCLWMKISQIPWLIHFHVGSLLLGTEVINSLTKTNGHPSKPWPPALGFCQHFCPSLGKPWSSPRGIID